MIDALPVVASGRYRATRFLGEGAHKRVYLARDTRLDREVALALIKGAGYDSDTFERVRREAQAMAQFGSHPQIVAVYDIGDDAGQWFIVTEYMAGGDLDTLLARAPERRLPVARAIAIGLALCRALAVAHRKGIIHRDIKPGNVWLTAAGDAKLGDFGIAVALDRTRLTHEGAVVGTPAYLAPEQALGTELTAGADLYSLGIVLYELLTGRRPFVADDALAVIYQHIYAQPVAPSWHCPDLPRSLEELILWLLAKAPDDRPAGAPAVVESLTAIAAALAADSVRTTPLPVTGAPLNPLDRLAAGVFVGREREMGELRAGLEEALTGRTRLLLISGEPGVGKTRTADELATYARLRGMRVLRGRCYEEGAGAYWPWVQLLREWIRDRSAADLREEMGSGAAEIAPLVTEIRERLPELPARALVETDQARVRMFDSVATFVRNAARPRPAAFFLDDLQWADKPSLLLLQFLAREIRDARLLIVATYRDVDLGRSHPLTQTLGELTRTGVGRRVALGGLTEADVARLIEITTAAEPPTGLAAAIYRQTDGNAFFVTEIVRLLATDGLPSVEAAVSWSITIPQGVREVVNRRLSSLSEDCGKALGVASVVGLEFDLEVVERAGGIDPDALLDLLAEAERGRVVVEDRQRVGRFAFSHAIIRDSLYEETSRTRRTRLHRRVGEALEALHAANLGPHLAELAHHFYAAAPLGDVQKAVDYARLAGDRARSLLAYEEAARHYTMALRALDLSADGDALAAHDAIRCDLLLALGEVQNKADDLVAAGEAFTGAAALARQQAAGDRLARAGLGYADVESTPGVLNPEKVQLLEEALQELGAEDSVLRARVLARLALEVYFGDSAERTARCAREGVAMARRLDDPGTLAFALHAERMVLGWSDSPEYRIQVSTEITRLAEQVGDRELALVGHFWRLSDLLELGDLASIDAQMELCHQRAEALRQPVYQWYAALTRAMRAMLDGRFEEADQLAGQALAMGQQAHDAIALQTYGGQLLVIRREQGRLQELEPIVQMMVMQNPQVPAWRTALAFIYGETGRLEDARREFESLATAEFRDLPRDVLWLVMLTVLAETCALLGDAARAARLYDLLLPYDGRNLVLANALACMGACSYYLGLLATAMGDDDRAAVHFEEALAMHRRMQTRPWLARTQLAFGALLLHRDPAGGARGQELLQEALLTARALGMNRLRDQVQALLGEPS